MVKLLFLLSFFMFNNAQGVEEGPSPMEIADESFGSIRAGLKESSSLINRHTEAIIADLLLMTEEGKRKYLRSHLDAVMEELSPVLIVDQRGHLALPSHEEDPALHEAYLRYRALIHYIRGHLRMLSQENLEFLERVNQEMKELRDAKMKERAAATHQRLAS